MEERPRLAFQATPVARKDLSPKRRAAAGGRRGRLPVPTLAALAAHLHDFHPIKPYHTDFSLACDPPTGGADFQDIKGQISRKAHY